MEIKQIIDLKNLENISPSNNTKHHIFFRKRHTNITKLTYKKVKEIRKNKDKLSTKQLAKKNNVSNTTIKDILLYRTWTQKNNKKKHTKHAFKNNNEAIIDLINNPLYTINPDGKIFTLVPSKGSGILTTPRLIQSVSPSGYYSLRYKKTSLLVHRVVFAKHGGSLEKGLVINHIDGNGLNNNIKNLEQVSYSKNNSHTARVLRRGAVKLTEAWVQAIRKEYLSSKPFLVKEQSKKYKVSISLIKQVIYNQIWHDSTYFPVSRTKRYPKKKIKKIVSLIFAKNTTPKKASIEYNISHSTIKYWIREEKIQLGLNTKKRIN